MNKKDLIVRVLENYIIGKSEVNLKKIANEILALDDVEKPWPRVGDTYYWNKGGVVETGVVEREAQFERIRNSDEIFRTEEYVEWLIKHEAAVRRLRFIATRDYGAGEIDWLNSSNSKYTIFDNYLTGGREVMEVSFILINSAVYFHKRPDLDDIVEKMGNIVEFLAWKPEKKNG